ncbi:hypothetical protein [Legionella maioricensis]|uniref:Fe-S protein n=1 Tax=Legionella maioricensis TaxID=2896528 RepID=A0A9X2CZX6_9GAMM|nr:hypothetical protein [Legionella maioricensis]MCL9683759.1 hypothetical protein [Legionella maioricensis]MCL9687533.1 hypothetical protein [Legionella maioricensis]
MKKSSSFFISCLIAFSPFSSTALAANQKSPAPSASPPSVGLFSLPFSQQPGPFLSFGQNIIEKNKLQIYLSPTYLKLDDQYYFAFTPSLLYGLTDSASFYLYTPWAIDYRAPDHNNDIHHSSGASDTSLQFEYAFYQGSDSTKTEFASFVTAVTLPSGTFNKFPSTGFGSPSYFWGVTFNQTFIDWLWFVSPGLFKFTPYNNVHLGSQYLYQLGIGHNIFSVKNQYIFSGLLELNGQYTEKNKIFGQANPNSGGNLVFIVPSLWFSTEKLIAQLGISLPISQHFYGEQAKVKYNIVASLGWTFSV